VIFDEDHVPQLPANLRRPDPARVRFSEWMVVVLRPLLYEAWTGRPFCPADSTDEAAVDRAAGRQAWVALAVIVLILIGISVLVQALGAN
jgi:hypothetical protein